jgi:kinesin family protein 5
MADVSEVTAVKVYARFRPTRPGHEPLGGCEVQAAEGQCDVDGKRFRFDGLLGQASSQTETYLRVGHTVVQEVMKGFNGSVIAYGQTGSGKTHTMVGPDFGAREGAMGWSADDEVAGLMTRIIDALFKGADNDSENTNAVLKVSMLEIYNDQARDLLDRAKDRPALRLHMNAGGGFDVQGLRWEPCGGLGDVLALLGRGNSSRATGATSMNAESSRSHMVVTVSLMQHRADGSIILSKLRLVDLAGSERAGKTGAAGHTLVEAKNINKSLSALSNCMHALTAGDQRHVPYRDSTLTKLLMDSLGGNAKTAMVVCLASDASNRGETLSTLAFGKRAKRIRCQAVVNRHGGELDELRRQVTWRFIS